MFVAAAQATVPTFDPLLDMKTDMLFDPNKDTAMDAELNIDDLMSSESKNTLFSCFNFVRIHVMVMVIFCRATI